MSEPKSKLASINEEIKARECYRRQQEDVINDLVERGNTQLMNLNYDIKLAQKQKTELKAEIRALKHDKQLLEEDLEQLRTKLPYVAFASA